MRILKTSSIQKALTLLLFPLQPRSTCAVDLVVVVVVVVAVVAVVVAVVAAAVVAVRSAVMVIDVVAGMVVVAAAEFAGKSFFRMKSRYIPSILYNILETINFTF